MDNSLFEKYRIIKTIDTDDTGSVYLVEEIKTEKFFVLRKINRGGTDPLYNTVIKDFREIEKASPTIYRETDYPDIIDFFIQDGSGYILLNYIDDESLKIVSFYPSVGKILNSRYFVSKGLARGGFGSVYLAMDLKLPGKYWALKEMQEDNLPDVMEKSFRVEAEMLSRLEHPGIPRISDFFIEENRMYLIMDYVKGESLKKKLKALGEGKPFSEEQVINWAVSLCHILSYLHTRPTPVVFRDLKPDNIMITPEGDLKLLDFGISRVFLEGKTDTTYALLTQGYAPQEQWMGKAEPRSDIYSLGATLYHLLSGIHPKEIAPNFPPLEEYKPDISPSLSRIISRCLEPKLTDRYQSIEEVKSELVGVNSEKNNKEKAKLHLNKAGDYENKGDYFNAGFEYMKALEFQKENHEIYISMAGCSEKLGFIDKALDNYEKAMNFDLPENIKEGISKKINKLSEKEDGSYTGASETKEETIIAEKTLPVKLEREEEKLVIKDKSTEPGKSITEKKDSSTEKREKKKRVSIPLFAITAIVLIVLVSVFFLSDRGLSFFRNYLKPSGNKINDFPPPDENIKNKFEEGKSLYSEGRYEEAIACYDRALELESTREEVWFRKGMALCSLGKCEEAIICYDKAIEINPEFVEAWNEKGLILHNEEKYTDAINCYDKAIELDPYYAGIYNNKAHSLEMLGRYDEALKVYDKALEIDPLYTGTLQGKGLTYFSMGEYEKALECYGKALEIDSNDICTMNYKGIALKKLEKYPEALECFKKVLELEPDNMEAKDNIEELSEL